MGTWELGGWEPTWSELWYRDNWQNARDWDTKKSILIELLDFYGIATDNPWDVLSDASAGWQLAGALMADARSKGCGLGPPRRPGPGAEFDCDSELILRLEKARRDGDPLAPVFVDIAEKWDRDVDALKTRYYKIRRRYKKRLLEDYGKR